MPFSKPVLIIIPARIEIPDLPDGERDAYGAKMIPVREPIMLSPWESSQSPELNALLEKLWNMTPEKVDPASKS